MKAEIGKTYYMRKPRKGFARLPRYVMDVTSTHVRSATVTETQVSKWDEWQSREWFEGNIEREKASGEKI